MTVATREIENLLVESAHAKALSAARIAAKDFSNKHFNGGDGGACGFGWVEVYGVKGNTRLGKALKTVGFSKSYSGALQLWNGRNGWYFGQSVDAAEAGARAYADVFKAELGLDRVYAGSRLD